jgi:hypothetical protein
VIDAVLLFGAINVVFEFVLLSMIPPKWRLRLLGNPAACMVLHSVFLLLNLVVHWGTVVGTMASVLSFVCSMVTVKAAQILYGVVVDGRFYTTGLVRYSKDELL